MSHVHLSKADTTEVEEQYVLDALRSGWVAPLGPHVDAFEHEVAERAGVAHALALSSGTAALHLALLELGAGPGTAVVVPSMTFVASAMPVVYTGAEPVFVDSRLDGNVDPELLLHAIDTLLAGGTRVVAAMSVDLFGRCAEYDEIVPGLADRGIPLLDDAAEAFGAAYRGRPAGSQGAAAVFSFNGNKILTTSGGGMLVSDNGQLIDRARYLSTQARQPADHYEHTEVGFNYRLSNVLAALGRAQLSRFDAMLSRRRAIRARYVESLADLDGVRVIGHDSPGRGDDEDNCWLTCIELDPAGTATSPERVIADLAREDIEARRLWKPMHLQPVFGASRTFSTGIASRLFARGVALPSGSALTDDDIDRVVKVLRGALVAAR
ncbi:DegT/DnrJ/EryC1/StrS family aminotransferase [Pengzhenrongella sicca]|uniref:DegT/DnrJ/EryC1/StrS family aminotransferase n=1 Tax=Pengzhenrongella sicca TaxID=2819238 RepID=A0A8A4ZAR4_9MICO|nr:DegT/DnrJ/EryC1/StrS family aminotransferase [Pengzhenrongella sicca]QTE29012.1 DegT/DnrJ/EryC1/StrS family aminotransferase [Pengzhenrongella sicca]